MIREFTVPANVQALNEALKDLDVRPEQIITVLQLEQHTGQGVLMRTQFRVLYRESHETAQQQV